MFILCIEGKEQEGAYAISNNHGDQILLMFEEIDDAVRYAGLLEADGFPPLVPAEVDFEGIVSMCEKMGYEYIVSTPDELAIPPAMNEL